MGGGGRDVSLANTHRVDYLVLVTCTESSAFIISACHFQYRHRRHLRISACILARACYE